LGDFGEKEWQSSEFRKGVKRGREESGKGVERRQALVSLL
jgi:hypothetical protein